MTKRLTRARQTPPTWDQFKSAVRRHDRDGLLLIAARLSSTIARGEMPDDYQRFGITPWNLASVARTALAWSGFQRPLPTPHEVLELCSMDANLGDGIAADGTPEEQEERLGKMLARLFFEQFPGQQSPKAGVARSILLFGSDSEHPTDFTPEAMTPEWFERLTGGLSLDDYVGAIFLTSIGAQQNSGTFDPRWLDQPNFASIAEVTNLEAVRNTFIQFLLTDPGAFKAENRRRQDGRPSGQKRFAFNPLQDKPFIELGPQQYVSPWVQAILMKALPPAIYFMGLNAHGESFTRDLGHVYQHYVGRQLDLIEGAEVVVHPEVAYGPRKNRLDSCDWIVEFPNLVVLVECKARQPVESLRTGDDEWLDSVQGSIGKAIKQLSRSHEHFHEIAAEIPGIDPDKPRIGLAVTLEPFYVNNNPMLSAQLPVAELPVGVISIGELEELVRLDAGTISDLLVSAPRAESNNVMQLNIAVEEGTPENSLLLQTWETIGFFTRLDAFSDDDDEVPES